MVHADRERSTATLRLVEALAGIGHWRYDLATEQVFWSDEVYRIHGLEPRSIAPDFPTVIAAYHADDQAVLVAYVSRAIASGEGYAFKMRLKRPSDGEQRIVRAVAEARRDGEGRAVELFGVFQDITDDETARIQIADSEAKYRLLAENARDIIMRAGPKGIISYASPSCRLLGFEPEQVIGRSTLDFVANEDRERVYATLQQLFSGEEPDPALDREFKVLSADGREFWLEGRPTVLRDESGSPVEFVTAFRDVTERKGLIDRLEAAISRADAALQQKQELVTNLSHDFKAPLGAILAYAARLKAGESPDMAAVGGKIAFQAEELLAMVGDLLDRAALDAGKLYVREETFSLGSLVASVIDALAPAIGDKTLTLEMVMHPDAPRVVTGDKGRTRRVLMNLAGNAIKFADVGQVTIEVAPCQQAGWIRFSVTDDGPGLSEALIPRLFERFMSPVEPMLPDRRGHGLGLAICKDIIGELGGDIGWSPNIEGLGSKFWFEIPLPESFITLSDTNAALPAKSVLVIDDNPAFRVLLGEMLRAMGHNVIVCGSGASGLAAAHDKHFDVAFVDLMLLDTSGEDVVLALRAVEPGPAIVLMSAADWNIGACRVERRPDAFLAKPFDATELVAVLTTVSSGRNTPD